jgi:hypothetical protein
MRLMTWLGVALLAQSCGGEVAPPSPSPGPERVRTITVGASVSETLDRHGDHRAFEVVAPAAGVLTVRLSWDVRDGKLELLVGDNFVSPSPPDWSPLVAQLCVAVGRTYRVQVWDQVAWDYGDFRASFILTTALSEEPPCTP